MTSKKLNLKGHHVALSVKDIMGAMAFYQKLGFQTTKVFENDNQTLRICHLQLGSFCLELFWLNDSIASVRQSELWKDLQVRGIKHFALQTEDIKKTHQDLSEMGFEPGEITDGKTGVRYFFLNDPEGNWVEILQEK